MVLTVALSLKITKKRGGTHDRATGGGVNPPSLQHGNNPHGLPNFNASRTDFFDRQALLNGGAEKVLINQGLSGAEPLRPGKNNSVHVNITT